MTGSTSVLQQDRAPISQVPSSTLILRLHPLSSHSCKQTQITTSNSSSSIGPFSKLLQGIYFEAYVSSIKKASIILSLDLATMARKYFAKRNFNDRPTAEHDEKKNIDARSELPNIPQPERQSVGSSSSDGHLETEKSSEHPSIEHAKLSTRLKVTIATLSLGGLMFGSDTAIIGPVLLDVDHNLGHELAPREKALITSTCFAGAFVGCLVGALISHRNGPKIGIRVCCVLNIVGVILNAASYSVPQMVVGRIFSGISIGIVSTIVPSYLAEVAPSKYRGRIQGIWTLAVVVSQFVSYGIGAGFAPVPNGWRYMYALPAIWPIALYILVSFIPESPHELISRGKIEDAKMFYKITTNPPVADELIAQKIVSLCNEIKSPSPDTPKKFSFKAEFAPYKQLVGTRQNLRKLFAACGLMFASQFTGFNSLTFFSVTLLATMGIPKPEAMAMPLGVTNIVGTLAYLFLVDRFGRRRLMLITLPFTIISCGVFAATWRYVGVDIAGFHPHEDATLTWAAWVIYSFMIVFVLSYSSAIGNAAWASTELFPMEIRAQGAMAMAMSNWLSNIIISATFLLQMEDTSPKWTYVVYGLINLVTFTAVYFGFAETKGMPLEEISKIFEEDFGVKKAEEWQKAQRTARSQEPPV
ncbi:myo-inositol transporter, variant 2 [Cadophora gregata f. sp. sojae]|nr:myo-inositol transporter, variant 2 [Cadophora gregata f. sp. sojae]